MMKNISKNIFIAASIGLLGAATSAVAQQAVTSGPVTIISPNRTSQAGGGIDYGHAKAMPMPSISGGPVSPEESRNGPALNQVFGPSGASPGGSGDGKQRPLMVAPPQQFPQNTPASGGVIPQEFGTSNQVYTTSEATAFLDDTYAHYPFRAAGKLFFNIGTSTFVCSASLIKPGVVVTAAHCVTKFGGSFPRFYSNWMFIPAFNMGTAPFGVWTVNRAAVLTSYFNGTDPCAVSGVVCQDDVAVLVLNKQGGRFAGNTTGWFGFGVNGFGFNGAKQALITQLGYPVALDGGQKMERTDSQGFTNSSMSNNTVIGSLQTGGSSGGPWAVNLGIAPSLSGTGFGAASAHNIVVGVTSWGFISTLPKQQGASPFTSGNITVLVNFACGLIPNPC